MRTLALIGAAVIALSAAASNTAMAWSSEPAAQSNTNAADLSDPDNFQALQDKINGKTSSNGEGFHFYGGASSGDGSGLTQNNPYGLSTMPGRTGSAFSYSPMPGFRGQGD